MVARVKSKTNTAPTRMESQRQALLAACLVAITSALPVTVVAVAMGVRAEARLIEEQARLEVQAAIDSIDRARDLSRVAARVAEDRADTQVIVDDAVAVYVPAVVDTAVDVAESTIAFRRIVAMAEVGERLADVAEEWGLPVEIVRGHNPNLDPVAPLVGPTALVVYRYDDRIRSVSRGAPNRGRLINGAPMPDGIHWVVRDHRNSWGTAETISALVRGLTATAERWPGGATPLIADISRRRGGRLKTHRSHRSGRDADVTYYMHDHAATLAYRSARRHTLDRARQWELFKYWIERDEVTYIFVDHRLLRTLYDYVNRMGEDRALVDRAFGHPRGRGVLRHASGHDDHFHVRFRCASADPACRE